MRLLQDKIDVTAFIVWFVENFPESVGMIQADREFYDRFK